MNTILGEHWDCGCDGSDLGKRRNMSDNWAEGGDNFDDNSFLILIGRG